MVLRAILHEYNPEASDKVGIILYNMYYEFAIPFFFLQTPSSLSTTSSASLKLTPSQHTQETRLPGASMCSLAQQMAAWNTQQLVRGHHGPDFVVIAVFV